MIYRKYNSLASTHFPPIAFRIVSRLLMPYKTLHDLATASPSRYPYPESYFTALLNSPWSHTHATYSMTFELLSMLLRPPPTIQVPSLTSPSSQFDKSFHSSVNSLKNAFFDPLGQWQCPSLAPMAMSISPLKLFTKLSCAIRKVAETCHHILCLKAISRATFVHNVLANMNLKIRKGNWSLIGVKRTSLF